jgi:hypothetical protein
MSKRHLLVSALVAVLCGGILVLFTNIEKTVGGLMRCGTLVTLPEARACR